MADLAQITDHIRSAIGDNSGLGKTVKIDMGEDGKIYIDGASVPNTVTNEDKPADGNIKVSLADLSAIGNGQLDPVMAFMQGKLKVDDMMLAQKLAPMLKR